MLGLIITQLQSKLLDLKKFIEKTFSEINTAISNFVTWTDYGKAYLTVYKQTSIYRVYTWIILTIEL